MAASIRFVPCKFCGFHTSRFPSSKYARFISNHSRESTWRSVVGLEIHAQIQTDSKLFSASSAKFGGQTNSQVSFFDAALPGTLPVLNRRCVEAGILTGLALRCHINKVSKFDRKHYFYADLPAGYQITQQRQPLSVGGEVNYIVYDSEQNTAQRRKIRLTQIQLEQDSGKSLHDPEDRLSLIDLSRAGVGLMEIVTEPEFTDGKDAAAFVKELQVILQILRTCDGKMSEGSLRVDANISVHKPGTPLGIRSEVKNLNSIRSVSRAIDFEIKRHIEELDAGRDIINETRSFDVDTGETVAMRDKERLIDYRFMPEPNLPPLHIYTSETAPSGALPGEVILVDDIEARLPELPEQQRDRAERDYGLPLITALTLVNEKGLFKYFEDVVNGTQRDAQSTAVLLTNELMGLLHHRDVSVSDSHISPAKFGELYDMFHGKEISISTVKKVLSELYEHPDSAPREIVTKSNWQQVTDKVTLTELCNKVMEDNPAVVKQYRSGKLKQFNKLIGRAQMEVGGRADPQMLSKVMEDVLS